VALTLSTRFIVEAILANFTYYAISSAIEIAFPSVCLMSVTRLSYE